GLVDLFLRGFRLFLGGQGDAQELGMKIALIVRAVSGNALGSSGRPKINFAVRGTRPERPIPTRRDDLTSFGIHKIARCLRIRPDIGAAHRIAGVVGTSAGSVTVVIVSTLGGVGTEVSEGTIFFVNVLVGEEPV